MGVNCFCLDTDLFFGYDNYHQKITGGDMLKSLSVLCCAVLTLISCSSQPDEIRLGVYLSLTGPTDSYGLSAKNGFDMALKEINDSGGLLGKNVRFITVDDSSRSYLAVMAVA